jgi:outer membrane protein OmpA-like peptidoglycan-associated protein
MDSFLSLPRFAKGGLAVLLAIALLGWAIVAYSAKQQQEIAETRDTAMATLASQGDREAEAQAQILLLGERLEAAEAELAAPPEPTPEPVEPTTPDVTDTETSELQTLRGRLTDTMTTLSARSATLQQRERDLARAQAEVAELTTDVEGLTVASEERDVLRGRLTETMTKLSAASATLRQRDRALDAALADAEATAAEIEQLEAAKAERDVLRARLTETMTALSARSATVQQKERELSRLQADYEQALDEVDALTSASDEQIAAGRSLDALTAKLGVTKQALEDGAAALQKNQTALAEQQAELSALRDEQDVLKATISEKQAQIDQKEQQLANLSNSLIEAEERAEAAKAELTELAAVREDGTAESSSLSAEIDSLEATLSEKEDAIAYAETELTRIQGKIDSAEQQFQEKQSLLSAQGAEMQGVEASLAALKADQAMVEAQQGELEKAMSQQEQALQDLANVKNELAEQEAMLKARRDEVAKAEAQLASVQKGQASHNRSLPTIPIADLGDGKTAILPIDPMQTPIPVQTKNGLRLTVVHFDLGSAQLTPGAMKRAKDAAAWIKTQADGEKIRLIGATDTIGTREDNQVLAKRRAQSLLSVFESEGIDPERIELISMGEAGGSETIDDQTAEPLNRCVGVFIGEN